MNRFYFGAALCLSSALCAVPPVTDTKTVATTITHHLKNQVVPLHDQLVSDLVAQRKQADRQEQIECTQAKKLAQQHCTANKRKLQDECATEKNSRKAIFSQLNNTMKSAKKNAFSSAETLGELLDHVSSYVDVLHEQAKTAQFKELVKKVDAEQKWLKAMRSNITRSALNINAPIGAITKR